MRRRTFLSGLVLTAAIPPAKAQQPGKVYRIAIVHPADPISIMSETGGNRYYRAFFIELRRLGYVEGHNLVVERYSGDGRTGSHFDLARLVVSREPALIYVISAALIRSFKAATMTIPIVALTADPVAQGFAVSIARPGSNITGVSIDAGLEILEKRVELLREVAPAAKKVAFLARRDTWEGGYGRAMQQATPRWGFSLLGVPLAMPVQEHDYRRAFLEITEAQADSLLVSDAAENYSHRRIIVELAARARLPGVYPFRDFVELGGLLSYAVDLADINRWAARQIDRILKGENPGEIPFYQPTKFELTLNLRTARELGLPLRHRCWLSPMR